MVKKLSLIILMLSAIFLLVILFYKNAKLSSKPFGFDEVKNQSSSLEKMFFEINDRNGRLLIHTLLVEGKEQLYLYDTGIKKLFKYSQDFPVDSFNVSPNCKMLALHSVEQNSALFYSNRLTIIDENGDFQELQFKGEGNYLTGPFLDTISWAIDNRNIYFSFVDPISFSNQSISSLNLATHKISDVGIHNLDNHQQFSPIQNPKYNLLAYLSFSPVNELGVPFATSIHIFDEDKAIDREVVAEEVIFDTLMVWGDNYRNLRWSPNGEKLYFQAHVANEEIRRAGLSSLLIFEFDIKSNILKPIADTETINFLKGNEVFLYDRYFYSNVLILDESNILFQKQDRDGFYFCKFQNETEKCVELKNETSPENILGWDWCSAVP